MNIKSHSFISLLIYTISIFNILSMPSAAHAAGDDEYYRIKLIVKTDSDWSKIEFQRPWDIGWVITESKIIKPERDQHQIKLWKLKISAPPDDNREKIIEFIVYLKAQKEDLEFTILKGNKGRTRVEVYNICSGKPYRIGTYDNSELDEHSATSMNKYKMPFKKISKFGTVHLEPQQQ
jgi:hypothetical protein